MFRSKRSADEPAVARTELAPKLLRFFYLVVGDQAAAESLTIEALAQCAELNDKRTAAGLPVSLLQYGIRKASGAPDTSTVPADPIVRAFMALPRPQRVMVVLVCSLKLSVDETAAVTRASRSEIKTLCAEGIRTIHRELTENNQLGPRETGPQPVETV